MKSANTSKEKFVTGDAERESISAPSIVGGAMAEGAHAVIGMVERFIGGGIVARVCGIKRISRVVDGAHEYIYIVNIDYPKN